MTTTTTTTEYPTRPDSIDVSHQDVLERLRAWANNDDRDVMTSLDEQAAHLANLVPPLWVSDSCATQGASKDYLSAVMRYKCERLGIPFPVRAVERPASIEWDNGAPLTVGETVDRGTVLIMGPDPRTEGGGGVYWSDKAPTRVVVDTRIIVSEDSNIRVRREDGATTEHGSYDQVVGRSHLRRITGLSTVVPGTTDEPVAVDPEVERLNREVERLSSEVDRLRTWQRQALADADTISEVYNAQADRRGWCSEADEITEEINGRMSVLSLATREREFEVSISGYIRVPFSYTVTVTASDEDAAVEMVSDDPESYLDGARSLLGYAADSYGAEFEDSDFEVSLA